MFKFTEEQLMIRDMVKEFTANEVEPRDRDMDENGFDFDLIPKLVDAGLMAIHLPEQYGGGGGDTITSEIVINEIAKGSASIALFLDAHWLAADMILYHGTDEQKAKYLPLVAEGKVFAFGLTESNAGSDAGAIKSVAEKQPDQQRNGVAVAVHDFYIHAEQVKHLLKLLLFPEHRFLALEFARIRTVRQQVNGRELVFFHGSISVSVVRQNPSAYIICPEVWNSQEQRGYGKRNFRKKACESSDSQAGIFPGFTCRVSGF